MNKFVPPSDERLCKILNQIAVGRSDLERVRILGRRPNPYTSSAPAEIISCRSDATKELEILCKYCVNIGDQVGHREGGRHEALVYERVLSPLSLRPHLFGSYSDPETGGVWLFVEYIGNGLRFDVAPQPQCCLEVAGEWLGNFFKSNIKRLSSAELSFLRSYDKSYYDEWIERTLEFSVTLQPKYPWLVELCEGAHDALQILVDGPQTVIHGELYPKNIICDGQSVLPIDWESAAIGPSEIDLASLVEGWSVADRIELIRSYCEVIGLDPQDLGLNKRLDAARMYWSFRWLGESYELTRQVDSSFYFDTLLESGRKLGIAA